MNATVDHLIQDALHLSEDQRITLAYKILLSVEPPVSTHIESTWDTEIRDRISRYKAGNVKTVPASEVFAEFDIK